jgi:hypothetical protein
MRAGPLTQLKEGNTRLLSAKSGLLNVTITQRVFLLIKAAPSRIWFATNVDAYRISKEL